MFEPVAPRDRHAFKLAVICALQVEAESVRAMFDKCWDDEGIQYGKASGDKNTYTTGLMGGHNVVLIHLPDIGSVPAAQAAGSLSSSFPKIELLLSVGGCGIVPVHPTTKEEIVLGDVVVSTAVTQYDFGRLYPEGFKRKTLPSGNLGRLTRELRGFLDKLAMRQSRQRLCKDIVKLVNLANLQQDWPLATYPGISRDHLYETTYLHQHQVPAECVSYPLGSNTICSCSCDQLRCKKEKLVIRARHQSLKGSKSLETQQNHEPVIHFGRFGSANMVMRSGIDRDKIAAAEDLVAFEMEGAGLWDEYPTILIKGACNYADSHKSKIWQPYAAVMAAACLKAILAEWVFPDELVSHSRSPLFNTAQMAEPSIHQEVTRGASEGSGGNSANCQLETSQLEPSIVKRFGFGNAAVDLDFSFREPVGIRLGQAPYIDRENFVGRESELKRMKEILLPESHPQQLRRLVLGGMGGIGKTQLIIAYTNQHYDDYTSAFWLDATSQATVETDFQEVAHQISGALKAGSLSNAQAVASVHQWLSHRQNDRWLLIFDNYDDPNQYDLQKYYPPASHGTIVITTRRQDLVSGQKLQIKPLQTVEEGLEILATRSGRHDTKSDPYGAVLAKRLAGLPLALVTAGAYLQTSQFTFQEYCQEYEARWDVDHDNPLELQEYQDRTLYTTWSISYERLKSECPQAAQLLGLLAYFDNQRIWYELICAADSDTFDWMQENFSSKLKFGGVMRTLTNYCFVEIQQSIETWSMHDCVHDWTLTILNDNIDTKQYQYALRCVASLAQVKDSDELAHVSYSSLAAHATRLVHEKFWQDDSLSKLTIHDQLYRAYNVVALLLRKQVRLPEAKQMCVRALAGYEQALGPVHPYTLTAVDNLGDLYHDQGKLAEAETMYRRALAGDEQAHGPDHPDTLTTVHNLGILYQDQGKLAEAETMYRRALTGREQTLGPNHPDTQRIAHDLALLHTKTDCTGSKGKRWGWRRWLPWRQWRWSQKQIQCHRI